MTRSGKESSARAGSLIDIQRFICSCEHDNYNLLFHTPSPRLAFNPFPRSVRIDTEKGVKIMKSSGEKSSGFVLIVTSTLSRINTFE